MPLKQLIKIFTEMCISAIFILTTMTLINKPTRATKINLLNK